MESAPGAHRAGNSSRPGSRQRFKLYENSRLYDVPADLFEQHPIDRESGSPEAEAARAKLQAALDEVPANRKGPNWDPYVGFREMVAR